MLTYKKGDLFAALKTEKRRVGVPHIVNNIKIWGSGFVIPLGKAVPLAKEKYMECCPVLGEVQVVPIIDPGEWAHTKDLSLVFNMCAQNGISGRSTGPEDKPIKYEALVKCMATVRQTLKIHEIEVLYCPKFGSFRAGGTWSFIEELIEEMWSDFDVTIFELEKNL
jgi:hypothetical protein